MKFLVKLVLLVVVLAAGVVLGASPLGKWYVNNHGQDLIGRKVDIQGFTLNILTGNVTLSDVTVFEANGQDVFMTVEDIDVNLSMTDLLDGQINVEKLTVDDAKMSIVQKDTVMNVDDMVAFMSEGESSKYRIGELKFKDCEVNYTDSSDVNYPFSYRIHDLKVTSDNFSTDDRNHIELEGRLQGKGTLKASYDGLLADQSNMLMTLDIKDVDLTDFTPLFTLYTGREVVSGTFGMESEITSINNKLSGSNKIILDQPKVQKIKNLPFKPEYRSLPLKTALYMLTDKNGYGELNVDVSGNMNSPKFNYRKIVFRAFCRSMVKVLTSPFHKKEKVELDEDSVEA